MNIYVESEICKKCSFFKKYDSLVSYKDPYHVFRILYDEYDSNDAYTFVGRCMKCNNNISLERMRKSHIGKESNIKGRKKVWIDKERNIYKMI